MTPRYGWSGVIALAIVGLAAALALSIALPVALRQLLIALGDLDASLLPPIIGLASALLAFAGVGISGLVGLQVLRRDRAENTGEEARAIAAALSGECEDLAGMFRARADFILERLKQHGTTDQTVMITLNLAEIFPLPTIIYEAVSPKIGLLGVALAKSTVVSYGRALVWKSYAERTMAGADWARDMYRENQLEGLFRNHAQELAKFAGLQN